MSAGSYQQQAQYAWAVLEDWLGSTPDGQAVRARFVRDPKGQAGALRHWLRLHAEEAPPQLATYVSGGYVDNLVTIARAGVVQQFYDASGWSLILQARGAARFLIILGAGLALAGFASFGYTLIHAFTTFNSGLAEAEDACHQQYVEGYALAKCLSDANAKYGGADFQVQPWIPLAAILFFAALVVSTTGYFLIRPGRARRA
jgi:hypothetical protein